MNRAESWQRMAENVRMLADRHECHCHRFFWYCIVLSFCICICIEICIYMLPFVFVFIFVFVWHYHYFFWHCIGVIWYNGCTQTHPLECVQKLWWKGFCTKSCQGRKKRTKLPNFISDISDFFTYFFSLKIWLFEKVIEDVRTHHGYR